MKGLSLIWQVAKRRATVVIQGDGEGEESGRRGETRLDADRVGKEMNVRIQLVWKGQNQAEPVLLLRKAEAKLSSDGRLGLGCLVLLLD